jgi:hypothetical protein
VLGEELALQVGDGEFVAVGDDEDLLERVIDVDLVVHLVHVDGAGGADLPDAGIGRQACRRRWLEEAGIGLALAGRTMTAAQGWGVVVRPSLDELLSNPTESTGVASTA